MVWLTAFTISRKRMTRKLNFAALRLIPNSGTSSTRHSRSLRTSDICTTQGKSTNNLLKGVLAEPLFSSTIIPISSFTIEESRNNNRTSGRNLRTWLWTSRKHSVPSDCSQDKTFVNPLSRRWSVWQYSAHFLKAPHVVADAGCPTHSRSYFANE